VYRGGIVGPVPAFPGQMEERITAYLNRPPVVVAPTLVVDAAPPVEPGAARRQASPAELEWLQRNATVAGPITVTNASPMSRDQLKHD
jgi:hypothetical protein